MHVHKPRTPIKKLEIEKTEAQRELRKLKNKRARAWVRGSEYPKHLDTRIRQLTAIINPWNE